MTNDTKPCDVELITSYLDEELGQEEHQQFETHLETCEGCRQALADQAANPDFWQEASSLLQATISRNSSDFSQSETPDLSMAQFSIDFIKNWLLPTDDPEMMGRVDEYEVNAIVGVGGMGAVLKGFDRSLLRVVAIKVMDPRLANNGTARMRFEREARAAAAISHDNVVDIYRVSEMNGLPYLVMPFARGPSLQKRVDDGGPLSTLEVIHVGRQLASGLAAAHEQGLVHRDIKPANILLNDGVERLLITDFGVASAIDDVSMTQTGMIAGTPQYMSPEQARGEAVDHRSDLFSLGSVLYTACTGRPPFRATAPYAILRKITDSEPRPIREINPEIPDWVECIISGLLQKDPGARYEDAHQVEELFEKSLAYLRQPTQLALPVVTIQTPKSGRKNSSPQGLSKVSSFFKTVGVAMLFLVVSVLAFQGLLHVTDAPEISGQWQGETWGRIELSSVSEASDWYSGRFVDSSGDEGVLHLEWSRLNRRYSGSWSIGTQKSGSIVLRTGGNDTIRGAIAIDSQTKVKSNEIRLRDFVWKHLESKNQFRDKPDKAVDNDLFEPAESLTTHETTIKMRSPIAGTIEKVARGISKGKLVKKGDFIVQIEGGNEKRLLNQQRAIENRLQKLQDQAGAYKKNMDALEDAKKLANQSNDEILRAGQVKIQNETKRLANFKSVIEQRKAAYDRTKQLFDKGLVNQREVETLKSVWDQAKSDLESARNAIDFEQREQSAKLLQHRESDRLAESKIQSVAASLAEVEVQIVDTMAELDKTRHALHKDRFVLGAPITGVIINIYALEVNQAVGKGELIVEIAEQRPNKITSDLLQKDGQENSFNFQSLPEMLRLVSDLETQISQYNRQINEKKQAKVGLLKKIDGANSQINQFKQQLNSASDDNKDTVTEIVVSLDQLQSMRQTLETQQSQLQGAVDNLEDRLVTSQRTLDTIINVLQLEFDSRKSELDAAKKLAQISEAKYEAGDADMAELQEKKGAVKKAEFMLNQMEKWLQHVNQNRD